MPRATTSALPVPLRPAASQLSMISPSLEGNQANRQSGRPGGTRRGWSPSMTTTPVTNHSLCGQPLLHGQRPSTRNDPGPSGTARPSGANTPVVQMLGLPLRSSAATAGSSQAMNVGLQPIRTVHPADPSAYESSSMASKRVIGSASQPPSCCAQIGC